MLIARYVAAALAPFLLAFVTAWAAAPAHAAGRFAEPEPLGVPGSDGRIAVDAFGAVLAVWVQRDSGELWSAWRSPGGRFAVPVRLGAAQVSSTAVTITPRGEAAVAYSRPDGAVVVRTALVGGAFGPEEVLGAGVQPSISADAEGGVLAAWVDRPDPGGEGTIRVAERPLGGRFRSASGVGLRVWTTYTLETDLAGHAVLVATSRSGPLRLMARDASGAWGAEERVPLPAERPFTGARVAMDRAGTTAIAGVPFGSGFGSDPLLLVRREATGRYGPAERTPGAGFLQGLVLQPTGALAFMHYEQPDLASSRVSTRFRRADGTVSEPQVLSSASACGGALAGNERGAVIAAFSAASCFGDQGPSVYASDLGPDGRFDEPVVISGPGAYGAFAALSASGAAALSWGEGGGRDQRFTVAVRDAPQGLGAAADAHLGALGDAVDPVVDVGRIPPPSPAAAAITVPVACTETCDVATAVRVPGGPVARRATATGLRARLVPGRRARLRVRLSAAQRRAVRRGVRLRVSVRAEGYSRRRATRTTIVRKRHAG